MDLMEFFKLLGKLKTTDRTGWKRVGIENPESVAAHSHASAVLALGLLDVKGLDKNRVLKMVLIHDLGEGISGDIPWQDVFKGKITEKEKKRIEKESNEKILSMLPEKLAKELTELWKEFEEGKTREAVFAKDIDKLELAIQTVNYEKEFGLRLDGFFDFAKERIKTPEVKKILEELEKQRT